MQAIDAIDAQASALTLKQRVGTLIFPRPVHAPYSLYVEAIK